MDALPTLTIGTTYPCCGKVARFRALDRVPRERYARVCYACNTRWEVTRATVERGGVRIDRLDWTDKGYAGA